MLLFFYSSSVPEAPVQVHPAGGPVVGDSEPAPVLPLPAGGQQHGLLAGPHHGGPQLHQVQLLLGRDHHHRRHPAPCTRLLQHQHLP